MNNKRFPANNTKAKDLQKSELTFLTDKKVDGEMYAYFQSISTPGEKVSETENGRGIYTAIVNKKNIGTQTQLCAKFGMKSTKTYRAHLQYLISAGYLIDEGDHYVLPNLEEFYLLIPNDTLQFLLDVVKTPVIKTYILLGTMWNWKKEKYEFSATTICEHLGLNPTEARNIKTINNYLIALKKFELIDYVEFIQESGHGNIKTPMKRLTYYTLQKPKVNIATIK